MRSDPCAVQGVIAKYNTLADGTLRVTIDLDELQKHQFHEAGMDNGVTVAVARLGNGQLEGDGA